MTQRVRIDLDAMSPVTVLRPVLASGKMLADDRVRQPGDGRRRYVRLGADVQVPCRQARRRGVRRKTAGPNDSRMWVPAARQLAWSPTK